VLLLVTAVSAARGRAGAPRGLRVWAGFALALCLSVGLGMAVLAPVTPGNGALLVQRVMIGAVPLSLAVAGTLAIRDRPLPGRWATALWAAVAVLALGAALVVPPIRSDGFLTLLSQLPALLACASVAVGTLMSIAFLQWWAVRGLGKRPAGVPPAVFQGVVEADEEVVGWFTYLGVLRGMRAELGAFRLRTEDGVLDVPVGATLVAALPEAALDPTPGDRFPALRRGEAVSVRGFVARGGGGFRETSAPVPGPRGLVVQRDEMDGFHGGAGDEAVLAVWRPFMLYNAVAAAAFLPIAVTVVGGLVRLFVIG
jgi:hypothetical protein